MSGKTKILVVGGGGREHAMVWSFTQSRHRPQLFCAPGNPGIAELARCVPLHIDDLGGIAQFVESEQIDLTVIGPEKPLVLGLADRLRSGGHAVIGPSASAARIEGSKQFAKRMMISANILTAHAEIFEAAPSAIDYLKRQALPIVVKADGLAQGKGVVVARTHDEAISAVEQFMSARIVGAAGDRLLVEQYLDGEEVTCMAVTDGERIVPLLASQDHKPLLDHNKGPNTGGMGAYAPVPAISPEFMARIEATVFRPLIAQLKKEGVTYQGVLYAGLMICHGEPYVLEFNCRFGDPEAQAVLPLLQSDFLELCEAIAHGRLSSDHVVWRDESAVCVVMTVKGYPEGPVTGQPIQGITEAQRFPGTLVFHAGTAMKDQQLVTSGGRVLGLTARGTTLRDALDHAYRAVDLIRFEGRHYRKDIGATAIGQASSRMAVHMAKPATS